jgi:hypothetical protein
MVSVPPVSPARYSSAIDSRRRPTQPLCRVREQKAQAQASRPITEFLLHGRQMSRFVAHTLLHLSALLTIRAHSRLLRHYNSILPCANSRCLHRMHQRALPTNRRQGETDRRSVEYPSMQRILLSSPSHPGCSFRRKN